MFSRFRPLTKHQLEQLPQQQVKWTKPYSQFVRFIEITLVWGVVSGMVFAALFDRTHFLAFLWVAALPLIAGTIAIMYSWIRLLCSGARLEYTEWDLVDLHPDPRYLVNVIICGGGTAGITVPMAAGMILLSELVGAVFVGGVVAVLLGAMAVLLIRWRAQNRILLLNALKD